MEALQKKKKKKLFKPTDKYRWPTGRAGPARYGNGPARPVDYRADQACRALRAVLPRASCLADGPSTTCWGTFHARLAR